MSTVGGVDLFRMKRKIEKSFCCKVVSINKNKVVIKPDGDGYNLEAMKTSVSVFSGIGEVEVDG